MGLLAEEGLRGALAWSRLPWSLRLIVLGALSVALRRAWETCDEAVARSWSALLFDEEEVEAGGGGVGRLLRRGAFGWVWVGPCYYYCVFVRVCGHTAIAMRTSH